MRRIVTALATTATAVVMLLSYHTSTHQTAAVTVVSSGTDGTDATADPTGGASSSPSDSPTSTPSAGATAGSDAQTVAGDVVQTRWGPVQVQITVSDGTITTAETLQVPSGNSRDQEINARAVPILDQEVLSAQSADIDTVSGATVTSDGYLRSLQSAIDAAHL